MNNKILSLDEYRRYGRQMILHGFGLEGQVKLKQSSAVVVGAGGLGCPALQYLAAAGIGRLGIIDHDKVELSNLQRQILHSEKTVDIAKAVSAAETLEKLNSEVKLDVVTEAVQSSNALSLLAPYDVILDCTDNAPTRYLLSDTAVLLGKPLVSGAAQKYDGQMCTYNLGADGPCYRCLFPKPPAQEMRGTCEETGILGVVTGVIGNMQALETIKILTGLHDGKASMLLFSALGASQFRSVNLRTRKPTCIACGQGNNKITKLESIDYIQFCGGAIPDYEFQGQAEGRLGQRIRAKELDAILNSNADVTIIDVRPRTEFGICNLPKSISVPLPDLVANPAAFRSERDIYVVCRLGNDSQIAVDVLQGVGIAVKDVIGGLRAWAREVDHEFPVY